MEQYIGEIRLFGGNFAPVGWLFCSGQLLSISQYDTLFALIGTTYGGDGQTTFALPNLQSRVPIHMGTLPGGPTYTLGQIGGSESITLTTNQLPVHSHPLSYQPTASGNAGTQTSPQNAYYAGSGRGLAYKTLDTATIKLGASAAQTTPAGNSEPVAMVQPYQVVNYIIATEGIYPPQP